MQRGKAAAYVVLQESCPSRQRRFAILALRVARRRLDATCTRALKTGKTAVKMQALPPSMEMNAWDRAWADSSCIRATASCLYDLFPG